MWDYRRFPTCTVIIWKVYNVIQTLIDPAAELQKNFTGPGQKY